MPYVDLESVNKNTVVSDLKSVIGKRVSQNQSPTLVAKLVKVGKVNCIFESVESDYKSTIGLVGYKVGVQYKVPTQYAWNSFFY
jgi:hypothetical protein